VGRLGVLVCWDQWYPEAARLMALAGAELLLYPTAIGWDPDDAQDEKDRPRDGLDPQPPRACRGQWPAGAELQPHRARGLAAGRPAGIDFWGNSHVLGPQGEVLAEAGTGQAELLLADVDLSAASTCAGSGRSCATAASTPMPTCSSAKGDLLESSFHEFASRSEPLYHALIAERDSYMAAALRLQAGSSAPMRVLAVVGAGHLAGLAEKLGKDVADPTSQRVELDRVPPPGRWGTWIGILITLFVLGGFAYGFSQGAEVGTDLVLRWVLATGLLGAAGCLAAGGHPLSIAGAFVASPLTPLHPAMSSGMVSALIEAWVRRPTVADFAALRDDVGSPRGWWRNRVARVLLNFFLTSLGTAIGVWLAGWSMIDRLL
jgi:hypothetical protein